jgi:pimeloyl-ACP methyl ester carboxylesterase
LDTPTGQRTIVVGEGPTGLVALCVGALEPQRVHGVAAVNTLASYVSDVPYEGQRLGTIVPGILRDVGDVPHLAALALPRRVVIAGGVTGGGKALSNDELQLAFAVTARHDAGASALRIVGGDDAAKIVDVLK